MDAQCILVDPRSGAISLQLGVKILTGLPKLIQIVVLSLLNIPGKDLLDQGLGGGMPSLIGANFDPDDETEIYSEVVRRVNKTKTEVILSQVGLNLVPDEKLFDLHVVSVALSPSGDSVDVKLRVVNETGRATDVVL